MDLKKSRKLLAILAACYWVLALMIYLAAGDRFRYTVVASDALSASATIGELVDGMALTQTLTMPAERATGLELLAGTYGRANSGMLHLVLTNEAGDAVLAHDVDVGTLKDGVLHVPAWNSEEVRG